MLTVGDSNEEKMAALALKSVKLYIRFNISYNKICVNFLQTKKFPDINSIISQFEYILENYKSMLESNQFFHKIK